MLNGKDPQHLDRQWMAKWTSTKPLTHQWMTLGEIHYFPVNTLIIITDGHAIWNINGQNVHVTFGDLIALEENSVIEIVEGGNLDLAGWQIHFNTYVIVNTDQEAMQFEWHVPAGSTYQKVQLTGGFLTSICDYLSEEMLPDNASGRLIENQFFLYGLLKNLYQKPPSDKLTTEKGIARSIDYMQEHYAETITREQLAQMAGISQWHYSRKFSEKYGKPPLDYLANYRVYRAQEELLLTTARFQDIAQKAGLVDAHYFSRRFKHFAGVSPRNYVHTLHQRKILCISPFCAEVLIGLGIIPHAVIVTPLLLPEHQRQLFVSHQVKQLEMPQYVIQTEIIRQEGIELILGQFVTEEMKKKLRTMSPIITGLPNDIDPLLDQFAALFNKQKEAKTLQLQMEEEVTTARQQLNSILETSATVMVLRVEPFGYRYLGEDSSGASQLLYKKLGLALPEPLKAGEAWFNPCSIELLSVANPDYLFVEKRVMENFSAEENMGKLLDSSQWKHLTAVRNERVFYVDTSLWVDGCGVVGHTIIIDQIVDSLMHG